MLAVGKIALTFTLCATGVAPLAKPLPDTSILSRNFKYKLVTPRSLSPSMTRIPKSFAPNMTVMPKSKIIALLYRNDGELIDPAGNVVMRLPKSNYRYVSPHSEPPSAPLSTITITPDIPAPNK